MTLPTAASSLLSARTEARGERSPGRFPSEITPKAAPSQGHPSTVPPQPVPTEAPSLSLPTGMPALDSRDRSRVRERSAEVTLGTCKCPWSPGHPPGLDAPHLRVTEHFSGSICEEGWRVQQGRGLHVFTAQFVPGVPAQSSSSQGYLRPGHPLGGHRLSRQVPSGPSSSLAPSLGIPLGGPGGDLLSGSRSEPGGPVRGPSPRPLSPSLSGPQRHRVRAMAPQFPEPLFGTRTHVGRGSGF